MKGDGNEIFFSDREQIRVLPSVKEKTGDEENERIERDKRNEGKSERTDRSEILSE